MLERYNQVFPGCAERIVAMAEQQASHRQGLEASHLAGTQTAEKRGQNRGFIIAMTAICGGIGLIAIDKDVQGLTSIITAIVGLTTVFVVGRYMQARERDRKRKQFQDNQLPLPYGQQDEQS